ncbi:MAG: biotin--[acetyl-CoA-carboxylase] ligase [Betaproteobacteria bacterium]|nr:biotin--[acetyl-CoA-carboxylase] ligase [Betaproteobacteria bacterium]MDE2621608.1 biotin--[acetyl-CoA-carboxylase] ligase [Betaproteobacteria bacterium]
MTTTDLDADAVLSALDAEKDAVHLVVVDSVDSTNERLLKLAGGGAASGYCLVSLNQTAGRGRQGSRWLSDSTGSLTFSLLWRFSHRTTHQLSGLPLAVSIALVRALDQAGVDGLALKWPNDLQRHGRKIAGILVELAEGTAQGATAVIGIGLNVKLDEPLADSLPNPAFDLRDELGHTPRRNEVLAAVLRHLLPVLRQFDAEGFAPFQEEWLSRSAHRERTIRLTLPNNRVEIGLCAGLTADGALLLKQGERITPFLAGDVSLRLN